MSTSKMSAGELVRRYAFMLFGLAILSLGIAFSVKCGLGTSAISSPPYVISRITAPTVGEIMILMHLLFVALQILIYRRRYDRQQLMQVPIGTLFGYFVDFWLMVLAPLEVSAYPARMCLCAIGILGVGTGVAFEVVSGVAALPGEGMVIAIWDGIFARRIEFRRVKVLFDVSLVAFAGALSLLAFGHLEGVREGTVAAAILVGYVAKPGIRLLLPFEQRFLVEKNAKEKGAGA